MIIHFKKTILIFVLSVCFNMFYINPECGRCCKRESKVNNQQGNTQCCKSCKGNKFQDVNSGSKEIKRDGGIKNNNIKNNVNYAEIRKIENNNEMTDAEIEKLVKEQKEVEERIKKEQEEKKKKEEERLKKQKEEEERLRKEQEEKAKKEEEERLRKEQEEQKKKEEERKRKLEEEKQRKEAEEKLKEEEAKRLEEQKKKEEERKRKLEEEQRLKEERIKKEQEEKAKKEEEERLKKLKEEQDRKQKEAEEKQKEEEERKRKLEEEKQRKEQEEKARLEKEEAEKRQKEEEERIKKEQEEKAKKEEEERLEKQQKELERQKELEKQQKELERQKELEKQQKELERLEREKKEKEEKERLEKEKKEKEEKERLEREKKKKEEEEKKKKEEEGKKKQRELDEWRKKYSKVEYYKKEVEEIIKKIKNDDQLCNVIENIRGIRGNCNAIRHFFVTMEKGEYKKNIEQFLNGNNNYIYSKLDEINKNINNSKNNDEERRVNFLKSLPKDKKYEKTAETEIEKSKYAIELYNVPFFSTYHGVGCVMIPFAFELTKDYEGIFPEKMIEIVNNKLRGNNIKDKDFHIYFCYQYFVNPSIKNIDVITDLLFRPHYFIAKEEIDNWQRKKEDPNNKKFIYNPDTKHPRNENICVVFGYNKCLFDGIIDDFALHDSRLSAHDPIVGLISKKTVNNIPVFYSFVLEKDKKIAAMTIHFFKFIEDGFKSNIGDEIAKYHFKTIGDAINFASTHNDTDVANFLKGIIKENAK